MCVKALPIRKKNKNLNLPTSYCPISLTCSLSKVFEIILDKSITYFCRINNLIPDSQFGFQQHLSTIYAINKVTDNITSHLQQNEVVGACLIDIEKAFDSAWIDGLIYILLTNNFPLPLIETIYVTITNKKFITWNGKITSTLNFKIEEELQQGSVISPKLFNLLTKGVLEIGNANSNNSIYSTTYADDLMVYAGDKDPVKVQNTLQILTQKNLNS